MKYILIANIPLYMRPDSLSRKGIAGDYTYIFRDINTMDDAYKTAGSEFHDILWFQYPTCNAEQRDMIVNYVTCRLRRVTKFSS